MREFVESTERQVVSAAGDRVRLSFLAGRTQVDAALPLDVPVASLMRELVKLVRPRETVGSETPDGPSAADAKHSLWELRRADGRTPLPPDITLREAGVAEGDLLRLAAQRALSAPTLYDDVVDAAARLNKAGYPSWDATAARWMAFAGVHLASAVWVYFLLAHTLAPNRGTLVGLSVVAVLALVGVAALAHRSYGQSDIGAALGWAVLPITAAVLWVALSRLGCYGVSAGCAAMVVVCLALFRAIGAGRWGFLATGVLFSFTGVALVVHAVGVPTNVVGAGLAVVATFGCLAVPLLKAGSTQLNPPASRQRDDATPAKPSQQKREGEPEQIEAAAASGAESVWAHVRSAMLTRSGFYTGLAGSAALGACVVLLSPVHVQWSGLAFASACAVTLGLYAQRSVAAAERAALVIPTLALIVLTGVLAQQGNQPMSLAALIVLLAATVSSAAAGATSRADRAGRRSQTLLAYLTYLSTAALIPLALWVAGAYDRLGLG
jgi:type VII secretion integral membrane protein EccD